MMVESENDNEMLINETKRQLFHGLEDAVFLIFIYFFIYFYKEEATMSLENEITRWWLFSLSFFLKCRLH